MKTLSRRTLPVRSGAPLLLAWTLCAVLSAGSGFSPDLHAQGYTSPVPYTPQAPPRPSSSSAANDKSKSSTSDDNAASSSSSATQRKKATRAYVFSPGYLKTAVDAIRPSLSPTATFMVQEKTNKIIVQDDAVNIATADQIALALDPLVQGIPAPSSTQPAYVSRYYSGTGSGNSGTGTGSGTQGTSGVFLPRNTAGSGSDSDANQGNQQQQPASSPVSATQPARVQVEVDLQERGQTASASADNQRSQVLVMNSGSTMHFQVARALPDMDFFRNVAAESGYPVDTKPAPSGSVVPLAWRKVGTQIAVKPVVQGNNIIINVYPEIVVDVDGGVQQVMPLEDLGTSITVSEGQEASLTLFPTATQGFNDAFFGRASASSSAMRSLTGVVTVRARVLEPEQSTTTANNRNAPAQNSETTPIPLRPNPDNNDSAAGTTYPDDGGYMYVGTDLPYVDYGYDSGYYNTYWYNYPYPYSWYNCFRRWHYCKDDNKDKGHHGSHGHGYNNGYYVKNDGYNKGGVSYSGGSGYKTQGRGYTGNNWRSNNYSGNYSNATGVTYTTTSGTGTGGRTYASTSSTYSSGTGTGQQQVVMKRTTTYSGISGNSYYNNNNNYNYNGGSNGNGYVKPGTSSYDYTKRPSSVKPASTYNPYSNPYRQPTTVNPYRQSTPSINPYRANITPNTQPRNYGR